MVTGLKLHSSQAPTFLTEDEERLKDFKLRLQVLEANFYAKHHAWKSYY